MNQDGFRCLLNEEFLKRKDKNPAYSLRSFARQLKLDPGSLSHYLSGQRNFSKKKVTAISIELGLKKSQLSQILNGAEIESFRQIDLDRVDLLTHWYYVAILESLELHGFKAQPQWIAEKLGLEKNVVRAALNQLFSAGVLSLTDEGQWKNNWKDFSTLKNENIDEVALRNHQKQLLKIAQTSIDTASAEKKSHTAYVGAIDESLIPEIKEEIKSFRRKIANLIRKKSKKKNKVYCLQVNFFNETGRNHENV